MLFTKKGNIKKEIGTDIKKNLKFLTSVKKLTVNNKQNSLVLTYLVTVLEALLPYWLVSATLWLSALAFVRPYLIISSPAREGCNHRLRTPNEAFFNLNPDFWAWTDKFWGILDIFGLTISTDFGTVSHLSMFPIDILQKTKPLYPHPKYFFLGLGFEFGLQKIRDFAIVCP